MVRAFFSRHPKPLAVFSHNDFVSAAMVDWLIENGYRVPLDVAVAGVDNHPLYALANVPLTTVDLHGPELGQNAVGLLLDRLRGRRNSRCRSIVIRPSLIIRESTVGRAADQIWLTTVLDMIRKHFAQADLIPRILHNLGWRQDVLAQRFHRAMGCTLLDYRDRLRLEHAAKLLSNSSVLKVTAVAREVGYSSTSRFAAAFRERFGKNPASYRAGVHRQRPVVTIAETKTAL